MNNISPYSAFDYAQRLGSCRIPEQEPIILQSLFWSCMYAIHIINGEWPELQRLIIKQFEDPSIPYSDSIVSEYLFKYPNQQPPRSKDVPLKIGSFIIEDIPNSITDEQLIQLLIKMFELHSFSLLDKEEAAKCICMRREYNDRHILQYFEQPLPSNCNQLVQYVKFEHIPNVKTYFLDSFYINEYDKDDFV